MQFTATLLRRRENSRDLISYTESNAGSRAEFGQTENSGCVETQTRCLDLCADAKLSDAFRAERCIAASCVDLSIDFATRFMRSFML